MPQGDLDNALPDLPGCILMRIPKHDQLSHKFPCVCRCPEVILLMHRLPYRVRCITMHDQLVSVSFWPPAIEFSCHLMQRSEGDNQQVTLCDRHNCCKCGSPKCSCSRSRLHFSPQDIVEKLLKGLQGNSDEPASKAESLQSSETIAVMSRLVSGLMFLLASVPVISICRLTYLTLSFMDSVSFAIRCLSHATAAFLTSVPLAISSYLLQRSSPAW
jgi:hypothetical protein